jgi:hypothetical protein
VNYFTLFSRRLRQIAHPVSPRASLKIIVTVEPDTTLLFLGSFFEELQHAPVRDDAKLDALAMHILDEGPKTLLGLVIRARAEKWLRRHLWTLAYDSLSPFEQGVRVVVDSTMRIDCNQPRQVFA